MAKNVMAKWDAMRAFRKILDNPSLVMWLIRATAKERIVHKKADLEGGPRVILAEFEESLRSVEELQAERRLGKT